MKWPAILTSIMLFAGLSLEAPQPADVIDLSSWMLTLPVETSRPGSPDEIKQPALTTFVDRHWFHVTSKGDAVAFRAHCGGATTKGSRFPRCELREMTADGRRRAAWSTDDASPHLLNMKVAITKTPPVKSHVVCAQIHDANDDVMMVRLEGRKLFVERNETGDVMLDNDYKLGTPFEVMIQAHQGSIAVSYNGEQKMNWPISRQGCYFKAGCYTQSNTDKGDAADSYGEVVLYRLHVEHRQP
jgi:hypothetical protein